MGHCYSLDLRVRVADFVEAGHSCRAAAEHFDVSESFAIKLVRRTRDTGSPAPARQGRPPGRGKLVAYESFLIQAVEAEPAITMPELAARLLEDHGVGVAPAMLSRFLCRRGFTVCIRLRPRNLRSWRGKLAAWRLTTTRSTMRFSP
jgi:transposase